MAMLSAIDKLNGLMLQSMLISQSGKPLERFQYVDISFPGELDNIQIPEQLVNSQQAPGCLESSEAFDASALEMAVLRGCPLVLFSQLSK
jgi:negative regulator of sigma E activity